MSDDKLLWPERMSLEQMELMRASDKELRKHFLGEWPPPMPIPEGCNPPYYITGKSMRMCADVVRIGAAWGYQRGEMLAPDGERIAYVRDRQDLGGRPVGTLFYVWGNYDLPSCTHALLDFASERGFKVVPLPERGR